MTPPATRQPNILFLFPDQWRWDWLGCEGRVPVRTPNLDALAARGTRFTQCRTNSPLCAPARACLATGRRYEHTGVPDNKYDTRPEMGTIFQLLRNAGYRVATCGKNDLHKGANDFSDTGWVPRLGQLGFTEAIDQGGKWCVRNRIATGKPEAYSAYLRSRGCDTVYLRDMERREKIRQSPQGHILDVSPHDLSREDYCDDFCGRAAIELLDGIPVGAPWLLWVNFPGPHEPFDPPLELRQRYDGVTFPGPIPPPDSPSVHLQAERLRRAKTNGEVSSTDTVNDHQQIRRNYAAMIEGIDEWIGRLVQRITERGELDNTIIVFSSDHGEMLGDLGLWYKCCAFEGSVHVPLICAGPGIRAGATSYDLIEMIDLAATFAELAGLPVPPDWDARSFAPALRGEEFPSRDVQLSSLKDWKMIFDGRWKLIETQGAAPSLFDLANDPAEERDVAKDQPQIVDRLSRRLAEELSAAAAPAVSGGVTRSTKSTVKSHA